jgi:hypothetical protein
MHTRILLRSRKGPFDVYSSEATHEVDLIGNNSGNLVFSHAAHKLLQTERTEISPTAFGSNPPLSAEINERYDVFVVPLANAFRLSFESRLNSLTELIERLTIPVVVLGVGAQSDVNYTMDRLAPIERSVRRFARAVLDRSPSIGVRGEFTESYLRSLGFTDVEQIGCPSMFMYGPELRVEKTDPRLTRDSNIAINISPYVKVMGSILTANHTRYPHMTYVAQDIRTLGTMLWGDRVEDRGKTNKVPIYTSHPMYQQNRIRFFIDPWPWMQYLRGVDFAFGTRIHGNITALIAGTPGFVLAHDSRTLELCEYFAIPHRKIRDVPSDIDPARLYEEADYAELNRGHAERFRRFTDFLSKHNLDHAYAEGNSTAPFDRQLARITFPPAVQTLAAGNLNDLQGRVLYLRESNDRLRQEVADLARLLRPLRAIRTAGRRCRDLIARALRRGDPTAVPPRQPVGPPAAAPAVAPRTPATAFSAPGVARVMPHAGPPGAATVTALSAAAPQRRTDSS